VAFAAAGAVLGFLRFNTHPASVFMGDAGSQLLGFTLAVLGLAVTQDATSVYSTAIPVLLAGIPILDTLSVMTQRFVERRSLFKADRNHLHHKLLGLGFDQRESVTLIYVAQIVLFVAAYLLRFESDLAIVGVYLVFCASVIGALHWAQRGGWRLRAGGRSAPKGPLSRLVDRLANPGSLQAWSTPALATGLAGYALVVLLQVRSLASDSLLLAGALLATLVVAGLLWRRSPLHVLEKAACYVAAALFVYLDATLPEGARWIPWLDWLLPLGVAVVTALRMRWSRDRRFELTPLDLLVVFMALIVPSLPGLMQLPPGAPLGVAKIMVLFYAIELLAGGGVRLAPFLRLGSTLVLAGLCLRPLLGAAL
jgi:UDP-GlcNAc:undecaprenyl-phosphate GlcNAc-1-phosphate transferase